jgi:glycerol uptake facilitator-like aquaporin
MGLTRRTAAEGVGTALLLAAFANPAVTLARAFTDSFTGIRLADVPGFVVAQLAGAAAATALFAWIDPRPARMAPEPVPVAPHPEAQPSPPGVSP